MLFVRARIVTNVIKCQNHTMNQIPNPYEVPTLSIREAARFLGMGTTNAYERARDGSLPTIAAGVCKRRVPTAALYPLLGLPLPADPKLT